VVSYLLLNRIEVARDNVHIGDEPFEAGILNMGVKDIRCVIYKRLHTYVKLTSVSN